MLVPVTTTQETTFAPPTGPKTGELAGVLQVPRLLLRTPRLPSVPRGNETVVVFPGFKTNDAVSIPLRSALRALGHQPTGWGFGVNMAEVEDMLEPATQMVEQRASEANRPVALVGWSNGGVFAREIARDRPDLIGQVITFGTPIFGGPKFTRAVESYSLEELERLDKMINERNRTAIDRPITAIYSKADLIVDWRACIDTISPNVENIEVFSTHAGMVIDPDVWSVVARRLSDGVG